MSDTMLAGRLDLSGEQPELRMEQVPVPEPGAGEVRVKVKSAGVCLTDVHLISGEIKPLFLQGDQVTLGHEVSGVIDKLGPEVHTKKVGTRVLVRAGHPRSVQDPKRMTMGLDFDGGWAEYVVIPDYCAIEISDAISDDVAAIIPDAISTPWSAIFDTAQAKPTQSAGVWGIGGLGAHAVKLLRAIGVAPIVAMDPSPEARQRAVEFGADIAFDSTAPSFQDDLSEYLQWEKLDMAFDFAGVGPVRDQMLHSVAQDGQVILVGISGRPLTIPNDMAFQFNKTQLKGHYGSDVENLHQLISLIARGRVNFDSSISETLPLSEAPLAVHKLQTKEGNPIRIVLKPELA